MLVQSGSNVLKEKQLLGFMLATLECQNSCLFCGADKLNSDKHIPLDIAQRQLRDWYKLGARQLIISGGEPLHNPELEQIIQSARDIGYVKVILYSTAIFDDVGIAPHDLPYIDVMMVSIFGGNAKKHDSVARRKGAFTKTINGIKKACDAGLKVSINTPVTSANLHDLHNIMDLLESLPDHVFGWQLGDIHPTFEAKKQEKLYASYKSVGREVRSILSRAKSSSLIVFTQEFPLCITNPWLLEAQELIKSSDEIYVSGHEYDSLSYEFVQPLSSSSKAYADCCDKCSLKGICKGVSSAYLQKEDIVKELEPLPHLSVDALKYSASSLWCKTKTKLGLKY